LTGDIHPEGSQLAPFDAVEDFRAAIRFARSKADKHNLDTERIIASGNSAGAVGALALGYV